MLYTLRPIVEVVSNASLILAKNVFPADLALSNKSHESEVDIGCHMIRATVVSNT